MGLKSGLKAALTDRIRARRTESKTVRRYCRMSKERQSFGFHFTGAGRRALRK